MDDPFHCDTEYQTRWRLEDAFGQEGILGTGSGYKGTTFMERRTD